jgi:hypothetical protein
MRSHSVIHSYSTWHTIRVAIIKGFQWVLKSCTMLCIVIDIQSFTSALIAAMTNALLINERLYHNIPSSCMVMVHVVKGRQHSAHIHAPIAEMESLDLESDKSRCLNHRDGVDSAVQLPKLRLLHVLRKKLCDISLMSWNTGLYQHPESLLMRFLT